jgi:hypothetical protein
MSSSSLASRRIFFGLNLLSVVFTLDPLEAMPPLVGGKIGGGSGRSVDGRIGVGAGVSVQTVAGEELGEGPVSSRSSFCGVVIFGAGGSLGEEGAIADWLPISFWGFGCETAGCSAAGGAGAFPRPRPLPRPAPRAAFGGIVIDD